MNIKDASIFESEWSFSSKKLQTFPLPTSIHHRGPGRPSKARSALNTKRVIGHSTRKVLRRQRHNESAARSRQRLNKALGLLWKIIPKNESMASGRNDSREACLAEKVEIAISYIKNLKRQLENK